MKVYQFFKVASLDGPLPEPILYAFTNDKELSNAFTNTRNMKLFAKQVIDIPKKEYKEFADKHSGYILGSCGFTTRSALSFDREQIVRFVATRSEEQFVYTSSDKIITELSKHTKECGEIFNNDLLKALNILNYFDILTFSMKNEYYFYPAATEFNDVQDLNLKYDMLELFVYFFGDTIKI